MRRARTIAAILVLLLAVAAAATWMSRTRIAQRAVDRELARLDLPGRALIEEVRPDRVVLRDLALGPAARPDLTAQRAVIALDWQGTRPRLAGARLTRPVLRLRVDANGRVSLGTLDRLLPPRTGEPPRFPDLDIAIEDGLLIAATPLGALRAAVTGEGNPAGRFEGVARVPPATIRVAGCALARIGGELRVRTAGRTGFVEGELAMPSPGCAGVRADAARLRLALAIPESFDRATGTLRLRLSAPRAGSLAAREALVSFSGGATPARIAGDLAVALGAPRAGDWSAAAARVAGPVAYAVARGEFDAGGRLSVTRAELAPRARATLARPLAGLAITPLGPLETAARRAIVRALGGFDLTATLSEASEGGRRFAGLAALDLSAASGLRARLRDGAVAVALDDASAIRANGRVELAGDGLPALSAELAGDGAKVALEAWETGGARLAATTLALSRTPGGIRIAGPILIDGPLAAGRVEGLAIPAAEVAMRLDAGFAATPARCLAVRVARLEQPRYTLTGAAFALCPGRGPALAVAGGGGLSGAFTARALAFDGVLAGNAFSVATPEARVTLAGTDAAPVVRVAAARLIGAAAFAGARRPLALDRFTAVAVSSPAGWRFAGRLDGGAAADLAVAATALAGDWAMDEAGRLTLARGSALVADRARPPRFAPLALRDVALAYAGGRVAGDAALIAAAAAAPLGTVKGRYDFGPGAGALAARLAIRFDQALQPYQLSERARGVVENVAGRVTLAADLAWRDGAFTGPATIGLDHLSFATAALGPVRDVDGTIALSDAPGLVSPPGQRLTIGGVDPGVAVENGEASLQLLGGGRVRVERLAFPLAGGTLALAPVTLDPAIADRAFTLTVTGLDAARFVEALDLTNFAATGIFDGVLPLSVSQTGSRITGGRLTARAPGGTLNYVGEIGDDLPGAARLAFDALKSMRYRNLTLGIDGDLDGELVTDLRFTGENQRPVRAGGLLPRLRPGVPFRFNVTVTAPFRRLLGTAAGLSDARPLIDEGLMNAGPPPR